MDLYKTCGVYLGYGLGMYQDNYAIENVMILGRVSKGEGGDLMLKTASEVLEKEFPDNPKITFHVADEAFKAVGQCIAAAALPTLKAAAEPAAAEPAKEAEPAAAEPAKAE